MIASENSAMFTHAGFFVLRTPLLPFAVFEQLEAGRATPALYRGVRTDDSVGISREAGMASVAWTETDLERAMDDDRRQLRAQLLDALRRPEVRDAIRIASPDLASSLTRWEHDADPGPGETRHELALLRYLGRMTYRPTPFGLLAGCTVGEIGSSTALMLGAVRSYQRRTRLDMGYLLDVLRTGSHDAALQPHLRYKPNSSLYGVGDRLHYVERSRPDGARQFTLTAVDVTPYLADTLAHARNGATRMELAERLINVDVPFDEADAYVRELVEAEVLVPELDVPVTGNADPAILVAEELAQVPGAQRLATQLNGLNTLLGSLDAEGIGASDATYEAVTETVRAIGVPVPANRILQVDLFKPAPRARLSVGPVHDMLRTAELLRHIVPNENELQSFVRTFVQRYERREVPLAEVLDDEIGIGLPPNDREPIRRDGPPPVPRSAILADLLVRAARNARLEVTLEHDDVRRLTTVDAPPLPDSFAVMATLAARSPDAIDAGDYNLLWHAAAGPPGAMPLGRFCYADPELDANVRRLLRAEEALNAAATYAEVVHLPHARVGNVLFRPVLREYEIPYLGRSGAPADRQIPLSDLTVTVVDDRVRLRSRRLGREVIPRLTTAHHFRGDRELPIYRFLGLLQAQGAAARLYWDWGALASSPFLPRVRFGRVILSRATWNVRADEIAPFRRLRRVERYTAFQQWREARSLPAPVVVVQGDQQLPLTIDSEAGVDLFLHLIRNSEGGVVAEQYPPPGLLCVEGPEGHFTHELVVPFVRSMHATRDTGTAAPARRRATAALDDHIQLATDDASAARAHRSRPLGSEWLYVKLYTGGALIDRLLTEFVMPLVQSATDAGMIDRWFFVRYRDPDTHLRLRLQGDPVRLRKEVQPIVDAAAAQLLENAVVWRVQYDTYQREIERYGGPESLRVVEDIFHADSVGALELIRRGMVADETERLAWAACGIDRLLDDFGLRLNEQITLMNDALEGQPERLHKKWGAQYRTLRPRLISALHTIAAPETNAIPQPMQTVTEDQLLDAAIGDAGATRLDDETIRDVFATRSNRTRHSVGLLRELAGHGSLREPIERLLLHVCHMHINRLLRGIDNSGHEPMLYDLVRRHARSLAIQANYE